MKRIERDKFIKEAENELFKDNIKLNEDINYLKSLNKNDDIDDNRMIYLGVRSHTLGGHIHMIAMLVVLVFGGNKFINKNNN